MSQRKKQEREAESASPPKKRGPWGALALVVIFALVGTNAATYLALNSRVERLEALKRYDGMPDPVVAEDHPDFKVVNAHEHLFKVSHLKNYMKAAEATGIDKTIFVASGGFTFYGDPERKFEDFDWSNEEILRAAEAYPQRVVPFASLVPQDPENLEKLKGYVAKGMKGLKLYNGHSNFHNMPLDDPRMMGVYAYCEAEGIPIIWHVRIGNFLREFRRVLDAHPDLKVILPHFGVAFYRPASREWTELLQLMEDYPNLYIDTSFGTRAYLVHGLENVSNPDYRPIFRDFFIKYSDRILMGSDMVVTGNSEKTPEWQEACIRACRDVLEKDTYYFYMAAKGHKNALARANNLYGKLRGLALPDDVLRQIYETNIERIFPGFWDASAGD